MTCRPKLWLIEDFTLDGTKIKEVVRSIPQATEIEPTRAMIEAVVSRMADHGNHKRGIHGVRLISREGDEYFRWTIHDYFQHESDMAQFEHRQKRKSSDA